MTTSNSFRNRHAVRSQPAPLVKRPGQYKKTVVIADWLAPTAVTVVSNYSSLSCPVTLADVNKTAGLGAFTSVVWYVDYFDDNGNNARLTVVLDLAAKTLGVGRWNNSTGVYVLYASNNATGFDGIYPFDQSGLPWHAEACNALGSFRLIMAGP